MRSPSEAPLITGVILLSLSTLFGTVALCTPLANLQNRALRVTKPSSRIEFRAFELCARFDSVGEVDGDDKCRSWGDKDTPTCCGMEDTFRSVAALLLVAVILSLAAWGLTLCALSRTVNRAQPDHQQFIDDASARAAVDQQASRRGTMSIVAGAVAGVATVFWIAAVGTLMDSDAYDPDLLLRREWELLAEGDLTRVAGVGAVMAIICVFVSFVAACFLALYMCGCSGCFIPEAKTTAVVSPAPRSSGEEKAV